jgi:hypothetical protein
MAVHSISCGSGGEGDPKNAMRHMFGPAVVDQQIRQAISTCWMMLPEDKRTIDNVSKEIRRIVERALTNLKDDAKSFAFDANEPAPEG